MRGQNHLALGLAVPICGYYFGFNGLPVGYDWAWLVVGSLLPDIDGDGEISRPGNWLPNVVPSPIRKALNALGSKVSKTIKAVLGHRGLCHWAIWGILLIYFGFNWLGIGLLLHLLGDIITVQGVPILGPLTGRKFSILPLRVGGKIETALGAIMWLGLCSLGLLEGYLWLGYRL